MFWYFTSQILSDQHQEAFFHFIGATVQEAHTSCHCITLTITPSLTCHSSLKYQLDFDTTLDIYKLVSSLPFSNHVHWTETALINVITDILLSLIVIIASPVCIVFSFQDSLLFETSLTLEWFDSYLTYRIFFFFWSHNTQINYSLQKGPVAQQLVLVTNTVSLCCHSFCRCFIVNFIAMDHNCPFHRDIEEAELHFYLPGVH